MAKGLLSSRMASRDDKPAPQKQPPKTDLPPQEEENDRFLPQSDLFAKQKKRGRRRITALFFRSLSIILCVYVCFLIFGLLNTNYIYDKHDNLQPEVLSVEDLGILKEYSKSYEFYLRCRVLYEKILTLDYELSIHPENALSLGMEYTELLKTVDKIATDIKGAEYEMKYTAIYNQMFSFIANDCGLYLQGAAMSLTGGATSSPDEIISGVFNLAVVGNAGEKIYLRPAMQNDFAIISSNMATLATSIKGTGDIDIFEWSPDKFLQELED